MPEIGLAVLAEASVASAGTCDIGATDEMRVSITGTTTITSFGTGANRLRFIRFTGILTLTHHATTLILPGGANITTAAGDRAIAGSDGSGNWVVYSYTRASGKAVVAPSTADISTTATNDDAAAGRMAEYVEAAVTSGSAVSLTTATDANVTSISLTAGDWDVSAIAYFTPGGTTQVTLASASISLVNATRDTSPGNFASYAPASSVPPFTFSVAVPRVRISLNTTTTIYLAVRGAFTVSTLSAWGKIAARRVR